MRRRSYQVGARVGRLTIISIGDATPHGRRLTVQCDCGSPPKEVLGPNLGEHRTKSCGCARATECAARNAVHGRRSARVYESWRGLKARVTRESHVKFPDYGGRGLDMDPRWQVFKEFYSDMGDPPSPTHSIERRNNDWGYWKDNCIWATALQQGANKRNNIHIAWRGQNLILAEACRRAGVKDGSVSSRVGRYGETHQQAFDRLAAKVSYA